MPIPPPAAAAADVAASPPPRSDARSGVRRLVRGDAARVVAAARLDDSQRAAVEARGELVRVLGAPGTGKTTVAVHAVLDRVAGEEVRPHEALVLAPTRVAAARLRHSLTAELEATTASPLVCSVQAFAYGLLRRDAAERGEPVPRLLSGPEQDVVLRELLAGHESGFGRRPLWPAELSEATRTRGFRAELRDLLMRAVEYGLDAAGLARLAEQEGNAAWAAAARVLAEYDEVTALSTPGGYDPAWILTAAADLIEDDPETAARVHEEVRLVVVDDAQELTAPAARLLRLLRSPGTEVVLIGDPDAATQTFRGADPRLMLTDPATITRTLHRSWRLTVRVATAAARLADRIGAVGSVTHRLRRGGTTTANEERPVASQTPKRSQHGTPPSQPAQRSEVSVAGESGSDGVRGQTHQPTLFDLLDGIEGIDGDVDGTGAVAHTSSEQVQGDETAARSGRTGDSSTGSAADDPPAAPVEARTPGATTGSEASEGEVETAVLATATAEARFIAARLRHAHLVEGMPYSRMAVIVRGAGRSATMRRVLAGDGIPVDVPGARVPLREEQAVRPFLRLFEEALILALGGPTTLDAETVLDLLSSPLGTTDSLAVRRLQRALRRADARAVNGGSSGSVSSSTVGEAEVGAPASADAEKPDAPDTDARRNTDDLLVAAVLGDSVLDDLEEGAPVSGLRRIRDVLAAGVAAAGRADGSWETGVTAETVLWAMWQASGLAEPWRHAALAGSRRADRDLDAVVALTDAAARYVDRLPQRGPDGFLEHVRGQDVAGDTLVARAPGDECVTLTTPAGAAGLEWDLVVVAGLQEGVWPDLRLRGSVLGSATLVDTLTGRGASPQAARAAVRADETRLLLVAVTRTCRSLLLTAVRNDDESPSPFLDLLDPVDDARPYAAPPPPMTTADLVASLRRRLGTGALAALETSGLHDGPDARAGDPTMLMAARPADRLTAALLERLGRVGVAGADPNDWWGLRGVSDDRPRRGESDRLVVSPSKIEAFARCELRWLLAGSGGQAGGGTVASSLGTLVHDIAATVDNGDHTALMAELERRWPELDLPPGWISRQKYEQATSMIDRLHRQHTTALANGWEVVGTEIDVEVRLGRAVVRGRVDRLERDAQGRLRVVDLKTGSSKPGTAELPTHPQLGAYQVAVEEGAFGELGSRSAGAALMQIGKGGGSRGALQEQGPLAESDDPEWAATLLADTAEGMAGSTFRANAGTWCRVCESRFSCPIQPEGETLR
ncbi:ATP-dependent helicase [Mobilicoccus massiliensis]|uniref:ATP-dependent helicase n=1 Tax=Mobilicoccus massiliensis TaxID=1522310 RepID=UPI000693383A|nr:PD-(D/E)XK nuclease family protein [Mobilicoccus massiliensis]